MKESSCEPTLLYTGLKKHIYTLRPKTCPSIKKNASISWCEPEISNFAKFKVYECTVDHSSFNSLCGTLLSGRSFS